MAHPGLEGKVRSCKVLHDGHTGGHRPVQLVLEGKGDPVLERALVRAKPLPIHMPIGCRPRPPQWPTFEQDFASVDEATRAWAETVACIEAEVQQLWGIEGAEARQASGRGKERQWVVRPAKQRFAPNRARPTPAGRAWRWMVQTSSQLSRLYAKMVADPLAGGDPAVAARRKHAGALRRAVERAKKLAKGLEPRAVGPWCMMAQALAEGCLADPSLWGALEPIQSEAEAWAAIEDMRMDKHKRATRAEALDKAAKGAASLLHRWTKPTKVWRPACRDAKPGDFGVLAEVRREQEAWARIWRADDAGRAHTPRPWEEAPAMRWQPITGEDVDRASRSFKARAGLRADDLHPRVFSLLSDQGKEAVETAPAASGADVGRGRLPPSSYGWPRRRTGAGGPSLCLPL